jgi:hypothetical protein
MALSYRRSIFSAAENKKKRIAIKAGKKSKKLPYLVQIAVLSLAKRAGGGGGGG